MTFSYALLKSFGFGEPANDKMLSICFLFLDSMLIMISIIGSIIFFLLYMASHFNAKKNTIPIHFSKNAESFLDIIFVIVPACIIAYIMIPALGFLFQLEYDESSIDTLFNVFITGHQWYWSYELDVKLGTQVLTKFFDSSFCFPSVHFDSYLKNEGYTFYLLEVDNALVIPSGYHITLYVTSSDVIHSWAVPQMGIKVDALPGRIARCLLYGSIEGVFYGQCSELCGVNHAFMPICVEVVKVSVFLDWLFLASDVTFSGAVDSFFFSSFMKV